MYSCDWKYRKLQPSRMVRPRNTSNALRCPAFSAWCAMVTVTPELSRIRVLASGSPQAGIVWKLPPIAAGPLLGHDEEKPGHSSALVITPSPEPPSHVIAYWRV